MRSEHVDYLKRADCWPGKRQVTEVQTRPITVHLYTLADVSVFGTVCRSHCYHLWRYPIHLFIRIIPSFSSSSSITLSSFRYHLLIRDFLSRKLALHLQATLKPVMMDHSFNETFLLCNTLPVSKQRLKRQTIYQIDSLHGHWVIQWIRKMSDDFSLPSLSLSFAFLRSRWIKKKVRLYFLWIESNATKTCL